MTTWPPGLYPGAPMTEAEWLASNDPETMLSSLGKARDRKLRLFACACCRRLWDEIGETAGRRKVTITEMYADGAVIEEQFLAAFPVGGPRGDRQSAWHLLRWATNALGVIFGVIAWRLT